MNGHIFTAMKTFAQVLDSADALGVEEQESLAEVLQRRLAERRREALLEAVRSARRQFEGGRCRPATPKQIVKRILA
jgi:CRISPR/Cas system-associated protein Cas7 (RAMP superfamily)